MDEFPRSIIYFFWGIGAALFLVIVIRLTLGWLKSRHHRQAWAEFAEEIGAEFSWDGYAQQRGDIRVLEGQILANDFMGWAISLKYQKMTDKRGTLSQNEKETRWVFMSAYHRSNDRFPFSIQRKNFLDRLFRVLVRPGIALGYPEVDRNFKVFSNDQSRVRSLFTNQRIQQLIQYLPSTTLKRTPPTLMGALLSFKVKRPITNSEQLRCLFELFAEILNSLRSMGVAEREMRVANENDMV